MIIIPFIYRTLQLKENKLQLAFFILKIKISPSVKHPTGLKKIYSLIFNIYKYLCGGRFVFNARHKQPVSFQFPDWLLMNHLIAPRQQFTSRLFWEEYGAVWRGISSISCPLSSVCVWCWESRYLTFLTHAERKHTYRKRKEKST